MDAKSLVLMEKENGILTKELGSYEIESGLEFVQSAYVEDGKVSIFLSTDRDVDDSEFDEVYDNYDPEYLTAKGYDIEEVDDVYNPTWCVKFQYEDDYDTMDDRLNDLITYHEKEMKKVIKL
jgi:hypothetical protein